LDLVISTGLCEFLVGAGTTTIIFVGFYIFGMAPYTDNIVEAVFAYGATFLFAFGVGLIFATLNSFNKLIGMAWQSIQRVLYIASGVFFLPQSMPVWVRDLMAWNPLLHSIEWFRTGFFPQYAPPWLDRLYLLGAAFACIVLGGMLQRSLLRRMVPA
jgi:ABC-type polysaccharide/polyol phosphate export permease